MLDVEKVASWKLKTQFFEASEIRRGGFQTVDGNQKSQDNHRLDVKECDFNYLSLNWWVLPGFLVAIKSIYTTFWMRAT